MRFRRLVLGSTAVLALVPGARAADAVMAAEPEPMEYVQICDTYGVGFYYIPGTETCLKVSGYIRTDVGAGAFGLTDVVGKKAAAEDDPIIGKTSTTHTTCARGFNCDWIRAPKRSSALFAPMRQSISTMRL